VIARSRMTFEGPGLGLSGMMRVLFQASYVRCCQVILDGLRSERPDLAQGAARGTVGAENLIHATRPGDTR
jgi:hypothetical protein